MDEKADKGTDGKARTRKNMKTLAAKNQELTQKEKDSIKVLNFIATFDGVITSEDDVKFLLGKGIEKFIAKKRQHLASITDNAYPVRIKLQTYKTIK